MAPIPPRPAILRRLTGRLGRIRRRAGFFDGSRHVWVSERNSRRTLREVRALSRHGFAGLSRDILARHGRSPRRIDTLRGDHVMGRRMGKRAGLAREGSVRLDIVAAVPLHLRAGNTAASVTDIEVAVNGGWRTGVLNCVAPLLHDTGNINHAFVRSWQGMDPARRPVWVGLGDAVETSLLFFRSPLSLEFLPDEMPEVRAGKVCIVINQYHWLDPGGTGRPPTGRVYDLDRVLSNAVRMAAGAPVLIVPDSPSIARVMREHWPDPGPGARVADWCWREVVLPAPTPARPFADRTRIIIGRHGRDTPQKWPDRGEDILAAHPSLPGSEFHVLGGADVPRRLLGGLPDHWRVVDFADDRDQVSRFIRSLDVYVWFPHPRMVDAHPLSILEAMAHGVPVVAAPELAEIYGDAILTCRPGEVGEIILRLRDDPVFLGERIRVGLAAVRDEYSPAMRRATFARLLSGG